jgi:UDP-N-acetylmuramate-alanine ligase
LSALARYYLAQGYRVTGTNMGHSPLLDTLASEGIEIVADGASVISENTKKVIYTEAIIDDETRGLAGVRPNHVPEIAAGQKYHAEILSYPEALAQVFNAFPMKIAVAGAHGKSTTSAMIGTVLHDVQQGQRTKDIEHGSLPLDMPLGISPGQREEVVYPGATTITGTLVKAFGGKNICIEGNDIMNIEACEYRNAFLKYKPDIAVVTNIDPDHLDFFKTEAAYQEAFVQFMEQSRCVVILRDEYEKIREQICPLDKGGQGGLDELNYIPYNPELTQFAKDQRNTPSLAENRMWYDVLRFWELKKYRFLRQKPLLNFIADFYCSELGLVIEVDEDNHENQQEYDTHRTRELEQYGLTILRFHNLKVMDDPVSVEKEIIHWIQLNPPSIPPLSRGQKSTLVIVSADSFEVMGDAFNAIQPGKYSYELPDLLVPGDHIRLDAQLAFVTSQLLWIDTDAAKKSLAQYPGSWRRMEVIGTTQNSNLVMSDYGHHPTEIIATLWALKKAHPDKKLIVFFEPHQYSRTYELRHEFATSFTSADMTYISDIYAARDIDERRDMITSKILADMVAQNSPCEYVGTLDDAREKLHKVEESEHGALILLLGAGNVDELRDVFL